MDVGVVVAVAVVAGVGVGLGLGVKLGVGVNVGVGLGEDNVTARPVPEASAPKPFAVQSAANPVSVGGPDPSQVKLGRFAPIVCNEQLLGPLLPVTFTGT